MSVNNLGTFLNIKDSHLRVVSGNVYAQGINIGGITVDVAHGLQSITNQGNVTTNTLQFDNATTGFTTTANATVGRDLTVTGNVLVSSNLTVTGNAIISDDLTVTGNTFYANPASVLVDSNVVTEYTGPHDRPLRKYPEVAMTANDNSSTSGYVASRSSGDSTYDAWKCFNGTIGGDDWDNWLSDGNYDTSDGDAIESGANEAATTTVSGTTVRGEWVQLKLPKPICLKDLALAPMMYSGTQYATGRTPTKGVIVGSIDGTNWELVHSFTAAGLQSFPQNYYASSIGAFNSSKYYDYFRLIIEEVTGGTNGDRVALGEVCFYGHEEGSGSLDTTLKSVYNVPATTGTQLEVYYDAKDLADGAVTSVTDLSGNGVTGARSGDLAVSNGAFTFDGTGDYISGTLPSTADGDWVHSLSMWFKADSVNSANDGNTLFYTTGSISANNILFLRLYGGTNPYIRYSDIGSEIKKFMDILTGVWYHLTLTYSGGGWANAKMYINGELTNDVTSTDTTPLTLTGSSTFYIGRAINGFNPSFNGSIANFRLYSKALNAGQIQELYDYQKDYFLGSKSQVTLYKGHLGVGVTEPSGQLELAGDERLQEYPPGPMSNYETLIPGHGVFCATTGEQYSGSSPSEAFDTSLSSYWHSPTTYNANTGVYEGSQGMGGFAGEWIGLKMPYKTQITTISLQPRATWAERTLHEGVLLGENNSEDWEVVKQFSGVIFSSDTEVKYLNVDSNKYYSNYVLVITKTYAIPGTTNGRSNSVQHSNIRFFGTPGPTTLDKGSLSLTRSLDVPRISRYDVDTETPRPEKLLVDFDTTVNSTPTDISGKGNHGAFGGSAYYSSADKAFILANNPAAVSSASTHYIEAELNNTETGNQYHSVSLWFKVLSGQNSSWRSIFESSENPRSGNGSISLYVKGATDVLVFAHGAGNLESDPISNLYFQWHHIVLTYDGANRKMYLDGVLIKTVVTTTWSGVANMTLRLGKNNATSGNEGCDCHISNFKLYWQTALEPSEVKKLYNLGRTGRSMVISDTAVGIGKAPEAQLDVRGNMNVSSFIKYDSAWFYAYDGNTSGTGDFSDYSGYVPWAYLMSGSKHFTTASASTSGGYYTAPVDGIYHFDTSVLNYPDARTGITGMHFSVNDRTDGTNYSSGYNRKTNMPEQENMSASLTTKLNMGDTVKVYVANIDCYTQSNHAFFSGYLITRI